jgi:inner membrane protein
MYSITHLVIGALMGEAFIVKPLGILAILWWSIAHSIPDVDFISSLWMDIASSLLAHH